VVARWVDVGEVTVVVVVAHWVEVGVVRHSVGVAAVAVRVEAELVLATSCPAHDSCACAAQCALLDELPGSFGHALVFPTTSLHVCSSATREAL
jgi:hypothetical protein